MDWKSPFKKFPTQEELTLFHFNTTHFNNGYKLNYYKTSNNIYFI